jgi:hypothetical protein
MGRLHARLYPMTERERLWRAFGEMYPQPRHETRYTDRKTPMIALEPAAA